MDKPAEIVIIRRNGFGDVLCAMPLVALCRRRFPGARITLVVDQRAAALTPFLKGIDYFEVIWERGNKYFSILEAAWKLRKKRFNLAISAKGSPMKLMNFFLGILRADQRIAYRDSSAILEKSHQGLRCLQLLDRSFEKIPEEFYPRLEASSRKLKVAGPVLLVSVTNNRIGSLFDLDKYAHQLRGLYKKKPFSVVINGEPKDESRAHQLAEMVRMPHEVILTSRFSDFIELVASVDAVFSGDGGLMHLAAALGKPQVVLFGGTKTWEWAPLSEKAVCLSDPHNVNFIPEETIAQALEALI